MMYYDGLTELLVRVSAADLVVAGLACCCSVAAAVDAGRCAGRSSASVSPHLHHLFLHLGCCCPHLQ